MLQKLTEEKRTEIIEVGISEFAEKGIYGASMSSIANKAGISVGVLYKYYEDKDAFFLACIRRSMQVFVEFFESFAAKDYKPLRIGKEVIEGVQKYSKEHADCLKIYHELMGSSNQKFADEIVKEIDGKLSKIFIDVIKNSQEKGVIRQDLDPRLLAFFFDNLLLMMEFSYTVPYLNERFKIYLGNDADYADDELISNHMLRFLESAFTFEESDIEHSNT